jgi:lipopolysaccharide transport system ATP-binding protein
LSDVIIRAEGLGKSYRLRHQRRDERYIALRDVLSDKARALGRRLLGRGDPRADEVDEEFWALRDISFEIRQGEVLGIIGRNGAGKSTLLKILGRITEPSEGRVRIRGRVASLLEVGTGFHPELTGRENVYLNGAILGMSQIEIRRKFDEIVAFAEIERFLDTPVKRYSSGMYVRLAFAVAAHLEQEILVVDEVLAVGDAEFQNRCLGKIKDVAISGGRTVIFVSHNMSAIQSLCPKTLRLDSGRSQGIGETRIQVEKYFEDVSQKLWGRQFVKRRLSQILSLEELEVSPNPLAAGQSGYFRIGLSASEPSIVTEFCVLIYSMSGARVAILDLRSGNEGYRLGPNSPLNIRGEIHSVPLVDSEYFVGVYVNASDVQADFLDLMTLRIVPAIKPRSMLPYASAVRGIVDLSFDFRRV